MCSSLIKSKIVNAVGIKILQIRMLKYKEWATFMAFITQACSRAFLFLHVKILMKQSWACIWTQSSICSKLIIEGMHPNSIITFDCSELKFFHANNLLQHNSSLFCYINILSLKCETKGSIIILVTLERCKIRRAKICTQYTKMDCNDQDYQDKYRWVRGTGRLPYCQG